MRLLFVCTGNLCRSPIAHGLASAWLGRSTESDREGVEILSAGTRAPVGEAMDPNSAAALRRLGGNPSDLHATPLTPELAAGADLVLTMTRRHRRAVLEMSPRGLRRTFTLLEAANLLDGIDVGDLRELAPAERARELGLRLHAARARRSPSSPDDIVDPIGRAASVHEAVADVIAGALHPLLSVLSPSGASTPLDRTTARP